MSDEKTVVSGPEFFAMIDAAAQRKVDIETLARENLGDYIKSGRVWPTGTTPKDASNLASWCYECAQEFWCYEYAEVDQRNKQ